MKRDEQRNIAIQTMKSLYLSCNLSSDLRYIKDLLKSIKMHVEDGAKHAAIDEIDLLIKEVDKSQGRNQAAYHYVESLVQIAKGIGYQHDPTSF